MSYTGRPPGAVETRVSLGPLVVSSRNPRYFTVAGGDGGAVYLTGSHIWNNLQDGLGPGGECAATPEANDFGAYLDFLIEHGHNFIRLWRWEHVRSQAAGGAFHLCMTPQPWPRSHRSGKFDLDQFDAAYFARLRERVMAAGERGIYVGVMLFEGWALHLSPPPDNTEGHPFHARNNVNGVSIESIVDYQVLPLEPRIQAMQEAYIRQVVDCVQDLPNVLFEVANESSGDTADAVRMPDGTVIPTRIGDSTAWQYWVMDIVKQHERRMDYPSHPIGMTMQYPVPRQSSVNAPLYASPADWISPGFDDVTLGMPDAQPSRWYVDPPAGDGRKVILSDTDHYAPGAGDALWAWKSFLRGHHPILMDFGIIDVTRPLDPSLGVPSYASFEPARYAMGDTLRYASRMVLVDMAPRGNLSTTGYALANPGFEYLVLQPDSGPFDVSVERGTYGVEWFSVNERETRAGERLKLEAAGRVRLQAPFEARGPSVAYLVRRVTA